MPCSHDSEAPHDRCGATRSPAPFAAAALLALTIAPAWSDSGPNPPAIDLEAIPAPSPDPADPFGAALEENDLEPVPGGPPTAPANLRADLVSNDWAELSWAPSRDDGEVVEYRVTRSDGHVYEIRPDQTSPAAGTQAELDKYWRTTSFIDCNYTRFDLAIHACTANGPEPGDSYSYTVTAVDDTGLESPASNTITVDYHRDENAPIPLYDDFYLVDRFVNRRDLSRRDYFIDEFELVFDEDFDGPRLDGARWQTALTWGDSRIINGEQQYFVNRLAEPDFGYDPFRFTTADTGESTLVIEAIPTPAALESRLPPICREPDPLGKARCSFLSGALSTHDRFGITYGYVEGRMRVSGAAGALSSFYLYHRYPGTDLRRHAPEIDIVEYLGENPFGAEDAFQTYHFDDVLTGETRSSPTMAHANADGDRFDEDFHTFGVLWEPQLVIWYIDGREVKRLTGPQVARQQMNIVTYLVAGSGWAPTPDTSDPDLFPLAFEIDYIRAWQRPGYVGNGRYPMADDMECRAE